MKHLIVVPVMLVILVGCPLPLLENATSQSGPATSSAPATQPEIEEIPSTGFPVVSTQPIDIDLREYE